MLKRKIVINFMTTLLLPSLPFTPFRSQGKGQRESSMLTYDIRFSKGDVLHTG